MDFIQFLQYPFIQRAIITGSFIGIACSALGLFLVLRKMSLIGDGLAHVSFAAIALSLFLGIYPLWISLPFVVIGSIVIMKISEKTKLFGDASIGIVSSICIAIGVLVTSLSKGFNADLFSYLFGNILTINNTELWFSVLLSSIVIFVIYFFYWDLFSTTFDEEYAKTTGVKTYFINYLLNILTAITVLLSIKVVGTMLVSALLILPATTSLQVSKKFKKTIIICCIISLISVLLGIFISLYFDLPIGAIIVLVNAALFFIGLIYKKYFSKS